MAKNKKFTKILQHESPKQDRHAVAPYNFVPLPEKVIYFDPKSLIDYDKYDGLTGYIECNLRTLTPLYTRTAVSPDFYRQWAEKIREMMANSDDRKTYSQFFHLSSAEVPLIPGSTLRGMIRSLVEIISYSKFQWVTDKQLFFRTMDNSAIGKHYRGRMSDNVESGLLKYQSGKYVIQKCQAVKVSRKLLGSFSDLYDGKAPNRTPSWLGTPSQYQKVWVKLSTTELSVQSLSFQPKTNHVPGILVITGDMVKKKHEFVFLEPVDSAEYVDVSHELVQRFHDPDQLSQWQEKAFPADKPSKDSRAQNGMLRKTIVLSTEGDPIFFLREDEKLVFFGRAKMFRLPYKNSPLDLVPYELRSFTTNTGDDTIDFTEGIFGYINEQSRKSSRAGSVSFTDATLDEGQVSVLFDRFITPNILGSPKPTAFQQYLVQSTEHNHNPNQKDTLAHYDSEEGETTIRGHKLYWHKKKIDETVDVKDWDKDTQHTQIRPVKPDIRFTFRIYFENLRAEQLGALLWALELPAKNGQKYGHKLGMGKSRGFGSVHLSSKLYLSKRQNTVNKAGEKTNGRYGQLLDEEQWFTPERRLKQDPFIEQFEALILSNIDSTEHKANSLSDVPRISALLKLLEWEPTIHSDNNRYMDISTDTDENEYYHRPVLPNAIDVK